MNITELEKDVMIAIAENQYADSPDSEIWSFAIDFHTKITKKEQISGVVSSLVKKGLAVCSSEHGNDDTVRLTTKGVKEYNKLKED
jgi:DNA-binding PadR family transcriptional regulator